MQSIIVEAQEWHGAVNMYRHIEQWDDAIRVAKFHGGIGACKRVTISLLMAVGTVEGAKYLIKHGLVEAAIDHATENGAYDLALELATQQMPKKLPDVYLKHALLLKDDEKYDKAEEEFLKAGKPKEAIDLYLHQHDWENAIRVAESFDSSSVPAVFLAHAAVCAESKDFSKAEELFLAASRPDLALSMYQDADLLSEAIRIAQIYLPHRAAELNTAYNSTQARAGKTTVKTDFMVIGRSMEQSKQWAQALEVYLSAKAGKIDPSINIEEIWDRAVEIARKYVTNRYVEVGIEISRRLVDIKKEESAADLLFEVGRQDDAINLCIQARKFEKAKSLAKGISVLKKKVDEAYQGFLITREDTKELVELGHSEDALNVLAKRGDWDGLWQMAVKVTVSQATLSKYVLMRVEELISSPNPNALAEAVQVLSRQLAPANEQAVTVYRQLVTRLFSRSNKNEGPENISTFSTLRDVLFNVANKVRTSDKRLQNELLHLLMAVHYQSVLFSARRLGLKEIAAKCAVIMLKYPEYIPADKAYYQAGNLCRELGGSNINLAFMLLNRYVDIAEAIDTADPSMLDSAEFSETNAIPSIDILPKNHYLSEEDDREEVRT